MRFHLVDAFTDQAFAGNPAGVVVLDQPADATWMQQVAAEMKHSETAFVVNTGEGAKSLRWFTPTDEVSLCGHATIAATHVLGGHQVYDTLSGQLTCTKADGWIEMDFPADPPVETGEDLSHLLKAPVKFTGRARENLFAVLDSVEAVRNAEPDLDALRATWTGRLIITAEGDDFVSRFFGPGVGVDEDPVTGSAHCSLAPYWARELGKSALVGQQISARGGTVRTEVRDDRVLLRGQAVTVVSGELHV
ncbi:PhzF family phenazine biosynthesis protein [Amycolatopsis echigonensis]|uniref:PhzF family phenazine biosynthesis protein n=1 Tax=Amycolatopsis echigonensis TaxID=2576905 RepID=A0A2N3WIR4_9PSEU|nr:PhzF family phenazine biosynthesis protein [Amycolatopsis niigatensis]PKV93763.1 PhzF family phenazine biosynthesis protein [Amycolatopsis niigatensis]